MLSGTATANMSMLPFYAGGDASGEQWQGRIDDVAIFRRALSSSQVVDAMNGNFAALVSSPERTPFSDDFSGGSVDGSKWNVINKGLESTVDGGYNAPTTTGGVLTLGGTANHSFWAGKTLESVDTFSHDGQPAFFEVDRLSLSGSGIYRSSMWIWADDNHYLHFSRNVGEGGWSYNWNDVGGLGGVPTGSGVNLSILDRLDGDFGLFNMKLLFAPGDNVGEARIDMFLDNVLVGSQNFTNWSSDFRVLLIGQSRASGNTVTAIFDNARVAAIVPEPSTPFLTVLGLLGMGLVDWRRRKRG